jgi:hypothetical protein
MCRHIFLCAAACAPPLNSVSLIRAGFERVFVCNGGTNAWGDAGVLPYDAFAAGGPPPDPRTPHSGKVNIDEAAAELRRLGIL